MARPPAVVRRGGQHHCPYVLTAGYRLMIHANTSRDQAERPSRSVSKGRRMRSPSVPICASSRPSTNSWPRRWSHFGRLDVLVNAAAIRTNALELVSAADVRQHFESNTLATFLCLPRRTDHGATAVGRGLVNIGDWATVPPYLDYSAYFASKGNHPHHDPRPGRGVRGAQPARAW